MSEVLSAVISIMYDCIEECLKSFIFPSGKRTLEVLAVVVIFCGFSIVGNLLHIPMFISIPEAITSVIVAGGLVVLYYISVNGVKDVKEKLKQKRRFKNGK